MKVPTSHELKLPQLKKKKCNLRFTLESNPSQDFIGMILVQIKIKLIIDLENWSHYVRLSVLAIEKCFSSIKLRKCTYN